MSPLAIGLIGIVCLIVLIALGLQVAFALSIVSLVGIAVLLGPSTALSSFTIYSFTTTNNFMYLLLPLFVAMGHFASLAGLSRDAFRGVDAWFSRVPAGLGVTTAVTCGLFGAVCGSSIAATAAVGKVAIPEMERYGYAPSLAAGTVAAGATIATMIPPSIPLILYGIITETSIGRLFLAGIIPGIISVAIYGVGIALIGHFRPKLVPPGWSATWRERFASLRYLWGIVLLFSLIMFGIYGGVIAATEAGALGAIVALLLCVIKRVKWSALRTALAETATTTAMVFFLMIGAVLFSKFVMLTGLPQGFIEFVAGLGVPERYTPLLMLTILVPMGMFLNVTPIILIVLPVFLPVLVATGVNMVWFAIVMIKVLEMAYITPPVGLNVYVIKAIAPHIPITEIFRGASYFLVLDVITLLLLYFVPSLSTWLGSIAS